jgi:hypothetical protein
MPSNPSRSELVAELTELRRLQLTSLADATYIGWTQEQEVAHQKRSNRIWAVQRELNGLDRDGNIRSGLETSHPLTRSAESLR